MNRPLLSVAILLLLTALVHAEPKQYNGTLAGRTVSAMLNWLDETNVSGVISTADAPGRQLLMVGRNTSSGSMKLTLTEGAAAVGTVTMTKVTSAGSIIWSGTVKFTDGNSGVLELQRAR